MTPTREETLQAERNAATGALADAVRKARDVALEEAAKVVGEELAQENGWIQQRIRALKSKP